MKKQYLTAKEISEAMGVSESKAYGIIRELNKELRTEGYLTVTGKVPVAFFKKKYFGFEEVG